MYLAEGGKITKLTIVVYGPDSEENVVQFPGGMRNFCLTQNRPHQLRGLRSLLFIGYLGLFRRW